MEPSLSSIRGLTWEHLAPLSAGTLSHPNSHPPFTNTTAVSRPPTKTRRNHPAPEPGTTPPQEGQGGAISRSWCVCVCPRVSSRMTGDTHRRLDTDIPHTSITYMDGSRCPTAGRIDGRTTMHAGRHTERCRGARVVQCRSLLDTAGRDAVLAEGGWDGCCVVRGGGLCDAQAVGLGVSVGRGEALELGLACPDGGKLEGGRLGVVSPWTCFMSEGRGRWYQGWDSRSLRAGLDDVCLLISIPWAWLSFRSIVPS